MSFLNIEIKARCRDAASVRQYLLLANADFRGLDLQTDTYFQVSRGRLKLRQGNIENNLIYYERADAKGPGESHFDLISIPDAGLLKKVLEKTIGIKVIVRKERSIYYIGNVKFHIDEVEGLGHFVEIEAGNKEADMDKTQLRAQCEFYLQEFGISEEDLISVSYSDLLMSNPVRDGDQPET